MRLCTAYATSPTEMARPSLSNMNAIGSSAGTTGLTARLPSKMSSQRLGSPCNKPKKRSIPAANLAVTIESEQCVEALFDENIDMRDFQAEVDAEQEAFELGRLVQRVEIEDQNRGSRQ